MQWHRKTSQRTMEEMGFPVKKKGTTQNDLRFLREQLWEYLHAEEPHETIL